MGQSRYVRVYCNILTSPKITYESYYYELWKPSLYCLPLASSLHLQLMEYICPDSGRGCGGQGNNGHSSEFMPQLTQLLVVRAEVMAPLADTVGFIDHKPAEEAREMQL